MMTSARLEVPKVPSGFRNRRLREAHALPLGWRHLTSVDVDQIKTLVLEHAGPAATLSELEACLLLWSSLMTGRHPAHLLTLSVRLASKGERMADQRPGLIRRQGQWGWWLPAAAPRDQQHARANVLPTSTKLYLPATRIVASLVERCVAHRRSISSGREQLSGQSRSLFTGGDDLIASVSSLLASRHPVGPDRARRATTTAESLTRWLPAELTGAAGGDVVVASIITGRVPTVARTAVHYGAVPHRSLTARYEAAIGAVDGLSHYDNPGEAIVSNLGDRYTPTDDAVRVLITRLQAALEDTDADAAERHHAMMRYTVALMTFAIAHRGDSGFIPAASGIHQETRFCHVKDKVIRGRESERLVWICDIAMGQLHRYEQHLDQLRTIVSDAAAAGIDVARQHRRLALFDLRSGKLQHWTLSAAVKDALAVGGLAKNAGRHWLRGKLVGRCSTESLHAFYGHGPVQEGERYEESALDPAAYRADIARVLDETLGAVGWHPRSPAIGAQTA
jgi:hypothetical protein